MKFGTSTTTHGNPRTQDDAANTALSILVTWITSSILAVTLSLAPHTLYCLSIIV